MIIWGTGTPAPMLFPSGSRGTAELAGVAMGSSGALAPAHGVIPAHGQPVPSPGAFRLELIKMLLQPPDADNPPPAWNHGFHSPSQSTTRARAGLIYGNQNSHILLPQATNGKRVMKHWLGFSKHMISFALSSHLQLNVLLSCLPCTCLGNELMVHLPMTLHYMLMVQTHIQNILRLLLVLFLNTGPWASRRFSTHIYNNCSTIGQGL